MSAARAAFESIHSAIGERGLLNLTAKIQQHCRDGLAALEWQPIETAPRGGSYLVFQPDHKSGRNTLPARVCLNDHAGGVRETTHWMPLPEPPQR